MKRRDELRDKIADLVRSSPLTSVQIADQVLDLVFDAGMLPTSVGKPEQILPLNEKPPAHHVANEIKRQIAKGIADRLPPGVGFCLLTFTFDPGWVDYMSNADRADMVRMMEELLKGWKQGRMGARS